MCFKFYLEILKFTEVILHNKAYSVIQDIQYIDDLYSQITTSFPEAFNHDFLYILYLHT